MRTRTLTILAASLVGPAASAQPISIPWSTIDSGGGLVSAGIWSLNGTIGQPDADIALSAATWTLSPGYWPQPVAPCAADFNADGFIDFFDFSDFVDCFDGNVCPGGRTADFNNDGFVDFFDFTDFVEAFEAGC
jgi:hypothetical protein